MLHTKARTHIKEKREHPVTDELCRILMVVVGALLVAVALEQFLVPNGFLDGGVVGISIIISSFFPSIPMGVFLAVFNIPFLVFAWFGGGRRATIRTAIGIAVLSVSTVILHHVHPVTDEFTIALLGGGALLGVGVGLALRAGGALDGTEMLASILSKRGTLRVEQIILAINFTVFLIAAPILGVENALASGILFYVVVAPIINKVHEGGHEKKSVRIISRKHVEIAAKIHAELNLRMVFLSAESDEGVSLKIIETTIPRVEETDLAALVRAIDPLATVKVSDTAILVGGTDEAAHH